MKHIVELIKSRILEETRLGNDPHCASWSDGQGILITTSEAQQIVDALCLPDENESQICKYAVVFTAENKEGMPVIANCYIDLLKEPVDPLKYFAQRIEASNDVWNVVVTFFAKVN